MIKFSKLTDYAVVILTTLQQSDEATLSASGIAARTSLPEPTVAKVLKLLVKADLVKSLRGANGGYMLDKTINQITIANVATAIEGNVALTSCVDHGDDACGYAQSCPVNGRWNIVNHAVHSALESVTLADMMAPKTVMNTATEKESHEQRF